MVLSTLALLVALAPTQAADAPTTLALEAPRSIAPAAGWGEIAWSAAGDRLSVSGEGGLWLLPLAGGEPTPAAVAAPGFRHAFPGEPAATPALHAEARRDDIWVIDGDDARRVTQGEDRFYDPVLSPDGAFVAFSGLVTGLHVIELGSGEVTHLGVGRWPSWHPSGGLVFERNADDGHHLVQADLLQWHPGLAAPELLLASTGHLDTFPSLSPDGRHIAWLRDGAVHLAALVEVTP